jgi:hypothetical protein
MGMSDKLLTATIEVAYVNGPKPGKKTGSVKTTDDQYYGVWPNDLGRFQPGNTYKVQYEEREFQGQVYKTIKFPKDTPKPAAQNGQSFGVTTSGASTKAVEMFVMGVIGRYLQGCGASFPGTDELTDMVRSARTAFERGMSTQPVKAVKQSHQAEFDDSIPF